ncbi:MAG: hypothetical protein SGPRY_009234, partial [Prymnesium sp.]
YEVLRSALLCNFTMVLPPEGSRVNLGLLYVRGAKARPMGGAVSVLLRLFLEEFTLTTARGNPSMQGLWDQGLFTDALISAIRAEHIYPFTYLQVFEWQSLTPLPPLTGLSRSAGLSSPGFFDPRATHADPSRAELVAAAPDWLYCLVGRWAVRAGWPSLRSSSVCSLLHLVESRSQFGGFDAHKANREYVMRAFGHWHLPPPLLDQPLRALRLSPRAWGGEEGHPSLLPLLHALSLLAIGAAVTGRVPVVPSVACGSGWMNRHPMALAGVAEEYVMQASTSVPASPPSKRSNPVNAPPGSDHTECPSLERHVTDSYNIT